MNLREMVVMTVPYPQTVKPFSKVSICHLPDGRHQIHAYLSLGHRHIKAGAQTGIAIEGSQKLKPAFGYKGRLGPLFSQQSGPNLVSMVAQKMCSYLARKVDADRGTTVIYWGTGATGSDIESVGDLSAFQAEQFDFTGPSTFGSQANLLPAVRYFVDKFADANWGMYVFLTQGIIDDLEAVKRYSTDLAKAIANGERNELKFVLLGVGDDIDHAHLEQLDHLNMGTAVDLWDYKIASEMRDVIELFAEVVNENRIVADTGQIFDASGNLMMTYENGVPALLKFDLPRDARSFVIELDGKRIVQPISNVFDE